MESSNPSFINQDNGFKELGADEYKRLKRSFDLLDPDHTGSIETEDLVSFMRGRLLLLL